MQKQKNEFSGTKTFFQRFTKYIIEKCFGKNNILNLIFFWQKLNNNNKRERKNYYFFTVFFSLQKMPETSILDENQYKIAS